MSSTLEITVAGAAQISVVSSLAQLVVTTPAVAGLIAVNVAGPQGSPGPATTISTDANNRTTTGNDGGIFTPDIIADPLAYYILAKA